MSTIEIILLLLPMVGLIKGMLNGAVKELMGFAVIFLGITGVMKFSHYSIELLKDAVSEKWLVFTAYLFTLLIIMLIIWLVARFVEKIIKSVGLNFLNRILGALIGMSKWAIILSVVVYMFYKLNERFDWLNKEFFELQVVKVYVSIGDYLFGYIPEKSNFNS